VARRDADSVLALYDPDIEMDASRTEFAGLFGISVYHGHEGLRMFDRQWREAFEDVETECEELIEAGEQVVSVSRYHVRGRAGIEVSGHARGGVWTIRDGKVARIVGYADPDEALKTVGLDE
jgi:ketosteroid isomerase-like protein